MMADFFIHALIAGLILACMTAPLGCFVVWRGMSYFGDAIAHSALLGVVLAILFEMPMIFTIIGVAILMALLLTMLQRETQFTTDTLLGMLAHLALASGVVVLALNQSVRLDLMVYLFGDILAVSPHDLLGMYILASVILMILWMKWRRFMLITLHEDIARIEGVQVERYRLLLMLMVALTVALSIKLVGLLLVTSMLILPAATARYYARSPVQMALVAMTLSVLSVLGGLTGSFVWDTPSGPSIVLMAGALFLLTYTAYRFKLRRLRRRASG